MIQDPKDGQQIVGIIASHTITIATKLKRPISYMKTFFYRLIMFVVVTMNTKFRKNVWVKRSDFILVEPIEEGDKVKAEICKILTAEHIKEYIKVGIWPECFKRDDNVPNGRCASNYVKECCGENVEEFEEKFNGPCHLSPNRNRPSLLAAFEDESTSSEDDS
ncbi:probable RNA-binding protein EIF1AD [Glossina fuscipes]|uniref:Probable RNA-binding protein EIF1AD n=1 Tax=Glossina fuscipes TaxID=7396 RepID=A0A9C5ZKK6_9MUSC|nr:probable RNA-binding protein EIF1AD [Glossina fuscipes]